jgi:hypothetical protein
LVHRRAITGKENMGFKLAMSALKKKLLFAT